MLLGGNKSSGQWLWDNGEPIKTELFAAGRPDTNARCLAMAGKPINYGYDDWPCNYPNRYACERNY